MIKGLENLSYKENFRRALDLLSLEKAQGEHIPVFQCLKGSYRGQKLCLCRELHREDKAQWVQVGQGFILI